MDHLVIQDWDYRSYLMGPSVGRSVWLAEVFFLPHPRHWSKKPCKAAQWVRCVILAGIGAVAESSNK